MSEAISTNSKVSIKWFIIHTNFQWLKKKGYLENEAIFTSEEGKNARA